RLQSPRYLTTAISTITIAGIFSSVHILVNHSDSLRKMVSNELRDNGYEEREKSARSILALFICEEPGCSLFELILTNGQGETFIWTFPNGTSMSRSYAATSGC